MNASPEDLLSGCELDFVERRQHAAEDSEEVARLSGEGSKV